MQGKSVPLEITDIRISLGVKLELVQTVDRKTSVKELKTYITGYVN